ncbi:MAG: hypothetical protein OXK82_02770 [Deltaproteobacteria bacterium]|nr:hypothetical protein [Deltaproteobacteria bacterium]
MSKNDNSAHIAADTRGALAVPSVTVGIGRAEHSTIIALNPIPTLRSKLDLLGWLEAG